MTSPQPFMATTVELSGQRLIEASAGTGKTYAIAALYLRLVVERGLPVGRILVVTFTNAATAELADRIRRRLAEARQSLEHCTDFAQLQDTFLSDLARRSALDPPALRRRLDNALRGFDEAAIFTIHGFCQRVLADRAFASGMAFETELEVDSSERLTEIVADFWRRNFYEADPMLIDWLLAKNYHPEKLLRDIQPHLGKPYLQLRQATLAEASAAASPPFTTTYTALRGLWKTARDEVRQCLAEAMQRGVLNANQYPAAQLDAWLEQLDQYLVPENPGTKLPDKFSQLTCTKLQNATRVRQTTPQHQVFEYCEAISQAVLHMNAAFAVQLEHLRAELLGYADKQLALRKQHDQKQSYDDLLLNLDRALDDQVLGPQLANAVRKRYPAALIDEFQDTDPVQYGIFQRIYQGSECPLFLVGDPKQAIYSFRGADIFAYLQAHQAARQQLTLTHNWRSTPELIQAVNTLFNAHDAPFLLPEISFYPVLAAEQTAARRLQIHGDDPTPLRLWFLHDPNKERGVLTKGDANPWVAQACAAEIARLLNLAALGQARLGDDDLRGGDIAVLVRTHNEGSQIRKALLALGIPSVQRSRDNVFATDEAEQVQRVLLAIVQPRRDGWVRAALATDLLGFDAEGLLACEQNETLWEQQLDRLLSLQHTWQQRGFARMFRQMLRLWAIPERLLAWEDGERRLTNVLHLGELLAAAALRQRLSPEPLLHWLALRRQVLANHEVEQQQLRLESDEQLVQIVTLHKSKGLQYPIVFYPFGWGSGRSPGKDDVVAFHDPEHNYDAVVDFGSADRPRAGELAQRERLAEDLRLLYVGLTRAEQRCYLGWGLINKAGDCALAWLFHQPPERDSQADRYAAVNAYYQQIDATGVYQQLAAIAAQAPGCILLSEPPAVPGARYCPPSVEAVNLQARQFTGSLLSSWRIGSFSALTRHISHRDQPLLPVERPDHDALLETAVTSEGLAPSPLRSTALRIADFPRGARAGSCWHEIFEWVDFTRASAEECTPLVEKILHRYGFADEWTPVLAALVERVVTTPLDGMPLRLCQIPRAQRLDELEFHYPVKANSEVLRTLLLQRPDWPAAIREHITHLDVEWPTGYMKGFIDLVFTHQGRYYLLDYKSNWLGHRVEDYHAEAMTTAMADAAYYLQYLIYTIALHRYLQLRLPNYQYNEHFGGVFYLFLRGMTPEQPNLGVYADCPPAALIEALDAAL